MGEDSGESPGGAERHRPRGGAFARTLPLTAPTFTVVLDLAGIVILLPSIQTEFGSSVAVSTWIVLAFVLAAAATIPAGVRVTDLLGTRSVLLAGLIVFGLATLAAANAPSVAVLLGARAVQGLGAGLVEPAVQSLVPAGEDRAAPVRQALGAAGLLAAVLGPVLPAALATWASWRAALGLEVVLAAAAVVVVHRGMVGAAPAGGGSRARPPWALLRRRRFAAGSALVALAEFASLGVFFALSGYLQDELRYSPLATGLLLLPIMLGGLLTAPVAEKLAGRVGQVWFLVPGFLMIAGSVLWLARVTPEMPWWFVLAPLAVAGAGFGAVEAPAAEILAEETPPGAAGAVWTLERLFSLAGVAAGVAAVSAVWRAVGVHTAAGVNSALLVCSLAAILGAALAAADAGRRPDDPETREPR